MNFAPNHYPSTQSTSGQVLRDSDSGEYFFQVQDSDLVPVEPDSKHCSWRGVGEAVKADPKKIESMDKVLMNVDGEVFSVSSGTVYHRVEKQRQSFLRRLLRKFS